METQISNADTPKRRKSVLLSKEEHKAFKEYRKSFNTGVECAEAIDIDRAVMERVLLVGSGSPETIEKIKLVISNGAANPAI